VLFLLIKLYSWRFHAPSITLVKQNKPIGKLFTNASQIPYNYPKPLHNSTIKQLINTQNKHQSLSSIFLGKADSKSIIYLPSSSLKTTGFLFKRCTRSISNLPGLRILTDSISKITGSSSS